MPFSSKAYHDGLKSTGKVTFNIASEASYLYILSGQKFTKNAKNCQIGDFLKSLRTNSVTRQVILFGQKMMENAKIEQLK